MSDKKIIIDEDWKTQVEAEKAAAERESVGGEPPSAADQPQQHAAEMQTSELPPASFEMLVTMLATEAMVGLGQLPHPVTGTLEPQPEAARYAIDMLEVLAEKTKGNLEPAEERGLIELLHQLRMAFVASGAASTPSTSGR